MSDVRSVTVIGAGIAGTTTAYALLKKGYKFKSKTDTEVLLYGLIDQGPKFVKKCNGMFAFAFYNNESNVAYIFRDRIGIIPIYYTIKNLTITFGSNVKPIYLYSNIDKDINLKSISNILILIELSSK